MDIIRKQTVKRSDPEKHPGGTPLAKSPRMDLGTEVIPKERYTSEEFMELEWEKIQRFWGLLPTSPVAHESLFIYGAAQGVRIKAVWQATGIEKWRSSGLSACCMTDSLSGGIIGSSHH